MCGRYITPEQGDIERHWELTVPANYFRSYNFAPSQAGPIIRLDDDGNAEVQLFTWGYQPSWSKRAWINARSETAFESRAFAPAARARRCLIPAIGWYEWQGTRAPKQPYVFHLNGFVPFAFAGIWTIREADSGPAGNYAILTRSASEPLRGIHHRMPAVLRPEQERSWMDPATTMTDAQALLGIDRDDIETYAVSRFVNKPANNSADCIAPLPSGG